LAELSIVEAINDAFHVELERDDDVLVMGEDVGRAGAVRFGLPSGVRGMPGVGCFSHWAAAGTPIIRTNSVTSARFISPPL
jgi:hypothetical protein